MLCIIYLRAESWLICKTKLFHCIISVFFLKFFYTQIVAVFMWLFALYFPQRKMFLVLCLGNMHKLYMSLYIYLYLKCGCVDIISCFCLISLLHEALTQSTFADLCFYICKCCRMFTTVTFVVVASSFLCRVLSIFPLVFDRKRKIM